jgi:hypothetical protein
MSGKQDKPAETDPTTSKVPAKLRRLIVKLARFFLIPGLAAWGIYVVAQDPEGALAYIANHLGVAFWLLLVLGIVGGRAAEAKARMKTLTDPKSRRKIKDPLQGTFAALGEWVELALFRDHLAWRIVQLVSTAFCLFMVTTKSLSVDDISTAAESGWAPVVQTLLWPVLWVILLAVRISPSSKKRHTTLKAIYNIANSSMKFPRPTPRMQPDVMRLQDPFRVVKVREWETLELPRRFRVEGPANMSVTDTKAWEELMENLDAKLPHPEGWHLDKDRTGTSAEIYPAEYPVSVLWKGEYDPDPLVFLPGADLDHPGETASFTFGETTPHIMATGGTGSGKSSFAEIVLAQAGIKPMPWDPTLYADCQIIDPKGPFANRWENRPNMTVTNGAVDIVDEFGESMSGVVAMAMHAEKLLKELERRSNVQQGYKGIATWIDLPDDVKKSEKLRPVIIVMDEFLDHVTKDSSKSEQAEVENAARDRIVYITGQIARKGRSLGLHLILIAQDGKMTDIGSALVRQMVARIVLGNMDRNAMARMFGDGADLGILPTARLVNGRLKGIPGRGRLMNAPGQAIHKVQIAWFGGSSNLDALDKFLPRAVVAEEAPESIESLEDLDGNGIPDAWENLPVRKPAAGTLRVISEADFDLLTATPESPESQVDAPADEVAATQVAEPLASPTDDEGVDADEDFYEPGDDPVITSAPVAPEATPAPAAPAAAKATAEPKNPWATMETTKVAATPPAPEAEPVEPEDDGVVEAHKDWASSNPFLAAIDAQHNAPAPAATKTAAAATKTKDPAGTEPFDVSDLFGPAK